ncbi:hypothetical protein MP228_003971 [Amoeboaphelidium protococcarum]|nr:hypothetical protein MP228_003971 [Amoeboaphelidium protococcarum]
MADTLTSQQQQVGQDQQADRVETEGGGSSSPQQQPHLDQTLLQPEDQSINSFPSNRTSAYYEGEAAGKKAGDLFFNFNTQDDDPEETAALQKGKEYQATYIVSESSGKFREVILTVSLSGIRVAEPANKKRTRDFEIDQILQYSYNRSQNRFTFAYLESDGVLTNYRFTSKDFFDIHQSLGSAIALMVKMKGGEFEQGFDPQQDQQQQQQPGEKDHAGQNLAVITEGVADVEVSNDTDQSIAADERNQMQSAGTDGQSQHSVEDGSSPMIVHSGDDDNMSIMTMETRDDQLVSQDDGSDYTQGAEGDGDQAGAAARQSKDGKRKGNRQGFNNTVRGWSLFNSGSVRTGSKKSPAELGSINETDQSNSTASSDTIASKNSDNVTKRVNTHGSSADKRRKSAMELFKGGDSKSPTSQFPGMSDALASANSIDSASVKELSMPAVDKKYDQYGREVLIKNLKGGKYDITAGTAEALVASLAEEAPPDTIYIEIFLLTYRHFMTPVQFIKLLRDRFQYQADTAQASAIIRVRVVSVFKKWAERHYYDFRSQEMVDAFNEFLNDINASDCAKYGGQIKNILDGEVERSKTFKPFERPVAPPEVKKLIDSVDFVTYWSPKRIAQELTLSDLKLFRQIKPDEFCIFLWGDKNDTRINNFNFYIERFNRIGFWVSSVVCAYKDVKKRADAINKFIEIMKYIHKFANYGTLMAIISGLNTTSVSRLKKTWELVNKGKQINTYKELEAKMSYRGNFKAYREIEAFSKPPFIPFFGLYVKDLTFMNDGNQKHLAMPAKQESKNPAAAAVAGQKSADVSAGISPATSLAPSILRNVDEELESTASLQTKSSEASDAKSSRNATTQEDVPPPAQMINFEKCKTIFDKIHAIRVYQQSTYKFEDEKEKDDGGFFNQHYLGNDADLAIYVGFPYGPPCIDDEKLLLEMSRDCEPSERGGYVANSKPQLTTTK